MRNWILSAAFSCALVPCTSVFAQTGYSILNHASSGFPEGGIEYGYNWNSGPTAGTGFLSAGGSAGDVQAGGSALTTDSVGNATSELLVNSATLNIPADALGNPAIPDAANAGAVSKANIASASVGVAASGTYYGVSGGGGGSAAAYAQVNETLQFSANGASSGTVTQIPFTFTVDGSYSVTTAAGDSIGDVQMGLYLNNNSFGETVSSSGSDNFTPTVGAPSISGWTTDSFASNTPGLIVFTGTFPITGPSATVGVTELLSAIAADGTGLDFSNTAALSFDLPTGVSYTSASGVFGTVAVPEPASATLVLGLLSAVSLRRHRSKRIA